MRTAKKHNAGYTLVEALLVITIIALVMALAFPLFGYLKQKGTQAGCIGNLRVMGVGFNGYLQDHDMVWPQMPPDGFEREEDEWAWWEKTMKDYGLDRRRWICPGDTGTGKDHDTKPTEFVGSYLVTQFDEFPNTAFRWNQPWAVEQSGFHGPTAGPNLLMPDGSVQQGSPLPAMR